MSKDLIKWAQLGMSLARQQPQRQGGTAPLEPQFDPMRVARFRSVQVPIAINGGLMYATFSKPVLSRTGETNAEYVLIWRDPFSGQMLRQAFRYGWRNLNNPLPTFLHAFPVGVVRGGR